MPHPRTANHIPLSAHHHRLARYLEIYAQRIRTGRAPNLSRTLRHLADALDAPEKVIYG